MVEYAYPSLDSNDKSTTDSSSNADDASGSVGGRTGLPEIWRTLPSLALPDGAHNYDRDTIFFHLPDPSDGSTVYGVSCYRQIDADKLKARTSDVTRGSVQKSVVVLSRYPLYGLIAAKCEMITHAYFGELDFSKVECLRELYDNLNSVINDTLLESSEAFLDLSPRRLILTFHSKILMLFKLLLLEKKVRVVLSAMRFLMLIINYYFFLRRFYSLVLQSKICVLIC